MYISLRQWRDLTDGHLYAPGDPFPHDGRAIAPARIAELESGANKAKMALIERVPEKVGNPTAEADKQPQATPQAKKRGRKPKQ
jgi:hypothetical protein